MLDDGVGGGGAQFVLLLLGVQNLLGDGAGCGRGLVARPGVLHGDQGILDVHANLIDFLLETQFGLAQLQILLDVGLLRGAVAQRNVQREADGVVHRGHAEQLAQNIAVAADQSRDSAPCGV